MVFGLFNHPVFAGTADDGCGPWLMGDLEFEGGGEYISLVQLRSCEMTRGISAFLQFQNNSTQDIKLAYRIMTSDKFPKDGEIKLKQGRIVRAGTCQACTARKGGIKSWKIISVSLLEAKDDMAADEEDAGVDGTVEEEVSADKRPPTSTAIQSPAISESIPVPTEVKASQQTHVQESVSEKKESTTSSAHSSPDGLVTDDGKIIPWNQVPVEFRPKDKR